jgi:hypothetical protein
VTNAATGIEEKSIEPLMNNVTEIVANEINKTFDFYKASRQQSSTGTEDTDSGGGSNSAASHRTCPAGSSFRLRSLTRFGTSMLIQASATLDI